MGAKSGAETPAGILLAFHRRRQWRQSDLARELGVSVEAIVRGIRALSDHGMPLVRDDSEKPQVWWRVPKVWVPQGVLFAREQMPGLLRALRRSARGRERDALLAHVVSSARLPDAATQVEAPEFSDIEQAWLDAVEDAAARRVTLGMRYFTSSRGRAEWRYVSVQRVLVGPPARFVAHCHRSNTLKWFRVENISLAKLEVGAPYHEHPKQKVSAFLDESVGGFHADGEAVRSTFVVRDPEARWVAQNLLSGMSIDPDEFVRDGIRVTCSTPSVFRVARFVVGLGGAARVETAKLAACVREIAQGALDGVEGLDSPRVVAAKRLRRTGE